MELQTAAENFSGKMEKIFYKTTQEIFDEILTKKLEGVDENYLARYFHENLAEFIAESCEQIKKRYGIKTVALSGGVFQNSLLTSLTVKNLKSRGFKILLNKMIPANDGGICIGQAAFLF